VTGRGRDHVPGVSGDPPADAASILDSCEAVTPELIDRFEDRRSPGVKSATKGRIDVLNVDVCVLKTPRDLVLPPRLADHDPRVPDADFGMYHPSGVEGPLCLLCSERCPQERDKPLCVPNVKECRNAVCSPPRSS
jgi:hypothetical protein